MLRRCIPLGLLVRAVAACGVSPLPETTALEIHPTKPGGATWSLSADPHHDPRGALERPEFSANPDGSFKVRGSQVGCDLEVRWGISADPGFDESAIATLDQAQLAAQGFMLRPSDWRNVEMTGYYRVHAIEDSRCNGEAHLEHVVRGARSTTDKRIVGGYPASCEATTYHANTYPMTGRVKLEKDLEHTRGYTADAQDPEEVGAVPAFTDGRWIGIKTIVYNLSGDRGVAIEQWIDAKADGRWVRVLAYTDEGAWGGGQPSCGGTDHTVITWGGPIAVFRADHLVDYDVRDLSIREISN